MDEKKKKDEKKVMLVKDASDGKLKAVTNVDKDGNIQTIDPTESNIASLLNVNTQDSVLEAFFKRCSSRPIIRPIRDYPTFSL